MKCSKLAPEEKWIIKGIPILFLIGAALHFLYNLTGEAAAVGLISPVNESIWEHLKLVLLPVMLWWVLYYYAKGDEYKINKSRWFGASLFALITALITIPLLYYFYTGAFGFDSLAVDVSLLFFALLFGQLIGLHYYRYGKGIRPSKVILIFALIFAVFAIFTFFPPELPIFRDGATGQYGR